MQRYNKRKNAVDCRYLKVFLTKNDSKHAFDSIVSSFTKGYEPRVSERRGRGPTMNFEEFV